MKIMKNQTLCLIAINDKKHIETIQNENCSTAHTIQPLNNTLSAVYTQAKRHNQQAYGSQLEENRNFHLHKTLVVSYHSAATDCTSTFSLRRKR